jgi:predicted NACHT family NTPase
LLRRAIFGSDRLLALAERPLLLTLMASLHAWRGGNLPEKREELYADAVELLLHTWESQRERSPSLTEPSLAEWLRADRKEIRQVLEELAFRAHGAQAELLGTADVPEGDLVSRLMHLSRNPGANPRQLVDYLRDRSGLLVERGQGVYTFPHRTFQEYLSACHLTGGTFPEELADLARKEPGRWREVLLLAGAKAARGAGSTVWSLADALCYLDPEDPRRSVEDLWGALLSGQVVAESADLARLGKANEAKLERLRKWRIEAMRSAEPRRVRRSLRLVTRASIRSIGICRGMCRWGLLQFRRVVSGWVGPRRKIRVHGRTSFPSMRYGVGSIGSVATR